MLTDPAVIDNVSRNLFAILVLALAFLYGASAAEGCVADPPPSIEVQP